MVNWAENRLDWDELWMTKVIIGAARSSCRYIHTSSIIVKNKRELASGYNGAPPGFKLNCLEIGCEKKENIRGIGKCIGNHAETNALQQLGWEQKRGSSLYTLLSPCYRCAKEIAQAQLKEVIYLIPYKSLKSDEKPEDSFIYLKEAGVLVRQFKETERMKKLINIYFPGGVYSPAE